MNESIPKVERDGLVAVIVSPGYGAGWSTWTDDPAAVFAPDVIAWIKSGKPTPANQFTHYGYIGGLDQAEIRWVPKGTRFFITDYDGFEELHFIDPELGIVA